MPQNGCLGWNCCCSYLYIGSVRLAILPLEVYPLWVQKVKSGVCWCKWGQQSAHLEREGRTFLLSFVSIRMGSKASPNSLSPLKGAEASFHLYLCPPANGEATAGSRLSLEAMTLVENLEHLVWHQQKILLPLPVCLCPGGCGGQQLGFSLAAV